MLLAIDTATRTASVALYDGEAVQGEMTWRSRENHTVELMAQILHLLSLARLDKSDLAAIGVALGPGSFTGLRVGMSVAKGLAFAGQIPLLGIPTLDAVAQAHAYETRPLWAVISAGRGRYSVAVYTAVDGTVTRVSDYALVDVAGLVRLASDRERPALFCGEIDLRLRQALVDARGPLAVIASPATNVRRAGFLAELAWARWLRGEADDVKSLAPTYMPHASVDATNRLETQKETQA
jgi:tRNA threonylcarbamoyladenosine biosynthesis protein TsaB